MLYFETKKEKFIFFYVPFLLFSLIPFFLITGPFLSDLSISLIGFLFLVYCFKKKNFSYFKNKYFYFFLFFWFYLILNSIIKNINFDSLKISFFYIRYGVFVIAIASIINTDKKVIYYFYYCIFICFLVLILSGFHEYFFGKTGPRVTSFFGDEKILGSYLSRLWPIFFGLTIYILKPNSKLFFLSIIIFILTEALIFLSGERTSLFYLNLSAIFIIIFSQKLAKLRLFTLFVSILLILTISYFKPIAKERIIDKTLDQMNLNFSADDVKNKKDIYFFSKQHTHHYLTSYKMFLDSKVLGVGVKNFRNFCNIEKYKISKLSCSTHPHNTYIQILTETGIIGLLFLLFIVFYFCRYIVIHLLQKIKGDSYFTDFEICVLSVIAIYLWPFVPTGNVFNNWLNIILILNLPFLIWSRKLGKSSKINIKK